ncbi:hypothetical protein ACQF4K_05435 [Ralstonia pseudosolanacearum]|uniref:hypothetical protein n=1 Tax=Ralstonia pseudosolanacearum TaxID=1310165 RepID=UPI003D027641
MTFESLPQATFRNDQVAVALSHSNLGGGHLGIAFHHAKDGPKVVHLAWHKLLRVEAIPQELKACWVSTTLEIPPTAAKAVVGIVRSVASRLPHVNYGINLIAAKGSFTPKGEYCPPKGSDGLTCASFVVEVLRAASIPLVKYESWKEDAANIEWAERVCRGLVESQAPQSHIDAVQKNKNNGLRLRPYEVAGAASLPMQQRPVDFQSAQQAAGVAEGHLRNFCPAP